MRQIAVVSEHLHLQKRDGIASFAFELKGRRLYVAAVTTDDVGFDKNDVTNRSRVFVKKSSVSLNYRIISILLKASEYLEHNASSQFFPIGSEFCGTVVNVGVDVKEFQIGDRVIGNGNYPYSDFSNELPGIPTNGASKELEAFHFSKLIKIPKSMGDEVGAAFMIGAQTSYGMIRRANILPGQTVLVLASTSNTSLFLTKILTSMGCDVHCQTTNPTSTEKLSRLDVKKIFLTTSKNDLSPESELGTYSRRINGFDAIFDPFCDIYFHKAVHLLKTSGTYLTCGIHDQSGVDANEFSLADIKSVYATLILRNITFIGNCLGNTKDLESAIHDCAGNKWTPQIDSVFTYEKVSAFLERTFIPNDRFGKVILSYN